MHNQCTATADCLVHYTRGYLRNVVMIATHKTATETGTAAATRVELTNSTIFKDEPTQK